MRTHVFALALLAGAALHAPAAAAGGSRLGVVVAGERLAVIDMHIHVGEWALIPPRAQRRNVERMPAPLRPFGGYLLGGRLTGEGVIEELDAAGIQMGVLYGSYFPATSGVATNEYVGRQLAVNRERLKGFAGIRVDQWNRDAAEQLRRAQEAVRTYGMIGLKLAPAHAQTRLDDERLYAIYALAARLEVPVYVHTGTSPFPGTRQEPPYTNPAYLEEAIRLHARTIFVLGHAGYDTANGNLGYIDECIRLARTYPNVYIEPGALGSPRAGALTVEAMRRLHDPAIIDRILYGSDGPQRAGYLKAHLERTVAAMQEVGYTVEEMRKVLADNFTRVYRLPRLVP